MNKYFKIRTEKILKPLIKKGRKFKVQEPQIYVIAESKHIKLTVQIVYVYHTDEDIAKNNGYWTYKLVIFNKRYKAIKLKTIINLHNIHLLRKRYIPLVEAMLVMIKLNN